MGQLLDWLGARGLVLRQPGEPAGGQRRRIHTDRYLDRQSSPNYTNRGNAGGFRRLTKRDFPKSDRLLLSVTQHAVRIWSERVDAAAGRPEAGCRTAGDERPGALYAHVFLQPLC